MHRFLARLLTIIAFGLMLAGCSKSLPTQSDSASDSAPDASPPAHDVTGCGLLIGDLVWHDVDGDGIQDADEPGIAGVTVILRNADTGEELARTTTDEDGWYTFYDLCAGAFEVEVIHPDGCAPTKSGAGAPDVDSNPNPAIVKLDDCDQTIDFGFTCGTDCDTPTDDPKEECGKCEKKVTDLTLRFHGTSTVHVRIDQKDHAGIFDRQVTPGETFTFFGADDKGTMGTEIKVFVDDVEHTKIHTSCSKPIGPGLVSGDFEVISGHSLEGGLLCPLD